MRLTHKPLLALAAGLLCLTAQAADLTLDVEGIDTTKLDKAALLVGVFTEASPWLKEAAAGYRFELTAAARNGSQQIKLTKLPKGTIAITIYQDTNGNGQLERGQMGIPLEPYGFSNDAVGNFGPPTFQQAAVDPKPGQGIRIRLR
jgi:uncharacterized protein (DUF2141 family)